MKCYLVFCFIVSACAVLVTFRAVRLIHATSYAAADAIEREGFRDTPPHWGFEFGFGLTGGVWFADRPLDENEGCRSSDVHLVVEIPDDVLEDYGLHEEDNPNRLWIVPAEILNRYPVERLVRDE